MKTKWKKLGKKLLSSMLVLAMMCSILPAGVITAAASTTTRTVTIKVVQDEMTNVKATINAGSVTLENYNYSDYTLPYLSSYGYSSSVYGSIVKIYSSSFGSSGTTYYGDEQGKSVTLTSNNNITIYYYVSQWDTSTSDSDSGTADSSSSTTINTGTSGSYTYDTTLILHANDGSGDKYTIYVQGKYSISFRNESIPSATTLFGAPSGYTQASPCWNTSANGSGTQVPSGTYKFTSGTKTVNLYAQWDEIQATTEHFLFYDENTTEEVNGMPSYQASGSTTASSYTFSVSTAAPTRSGYSFVGWSTVEGATTANYYGDGSITVTGSTTLYAVWKVATSDISLSYALGAGSAPTGDATAFDTVTKTVNTGASATFTVSGVAPVQDGNVFKYWSGSDGKTYDADDTITTASDITLTAVWGRDKDNDGKEDADVTLTYNLDGGEATADFPSVTNIVNLGEATTFTVTAEKPTKTGYDFINWSGSDGKTYDAEDTITTDSDITLTANWNATKYDITYDGLADATFEGEGNPDTYTIEDEFTLENPSKTGYVFTGWTGSNGATPDEEVKIAEGTTDALEYTANWALDTNNDGEADDKETKYTVIYTDGVEDEVFADENYTGKLVGNDTPAFAGSTIREGYVFAGWEPEVAEKIDEEDAEEVAGEMVIQYTATWQKTAPDVSATDCTTDENTDGTITGTDATMEYRKVAEDGEDENEWIAITGDSVTDLVPGDYEVRYAAVMNGEEIAQAASVSTTVTVGEYVEPTVDPDDDDDDDTTTTTDDDDDTTTTTPTTTVTTVDVDTTVIEDTVVPATAATTAATTATTATTTTTTADPEEDDAEEPAEEPATEIEEDEVPLADAAEEAATEIEEEEVPLVANETTTGWALVNLFFAIGIAATSIVMLAGYFLNRRDEEEGKPSATSRLISLLPALLGVLCFSLTQNMANPMALVDSWTLVMVLIALLQAAVVVKVRKDEGNQEDSTFA